MYDYDENYGAIATCIFPVSILPTSVLLNIFLLCRERPKRLNAFLSLIFYTPILALGTLVFLVIYTILSPIAYLFVILHKFILIFRRTPQSRWSKLAEFLIFFVVGPFLLAIRDIVDTYLFLLNSVRSSSPKHKLCHSAGQYMPIKTCYVLLYIIQYLGTKANNMLYTDFLLSCYKGLKQSKQCSVSLGEENKGAMLSKEIILEFCKEVKDAEMYGEVQQ